MDRVARRSGGGVWEGLYRVLMRRTPVYVTFVVVGAFFGERAVDYGVHRLWESNNVGLIGCSAVNQPLQIIPPVSVRGKFFIY